MTLLQGLSVIIRRIRVNHGGRKQRTIESIREGEQRVRYLIFADMLSNLHSQWADHKVVGEELWKRFNAPKENQSWYYSARLDAFDE